MKSHYIFGLIQVKCNVVHPIDRAIYFGFITFFVLLYLSGQLTLYIKIKKHLVLPTSHQEDESIGGKNTTSEPRAPTTSTLVDSIRARSLTDVDEDTISPGEAVKALGQRLVPSYAIRQNLQLVRIRYQIVSRLELEATRNVVFGVGIMLLFSLPWIVSCILSMTCNANADSNQPLGEEETTKILIGRCGRYYWATSYTKLLSLIGHFIYQFVCYLSRSKEFCAGLSRAQKRIERDGCSGTRKPRENLRHPHRQRMRETHRQRYNRHPGFLLRSEPTQKNGTAYFNDRPPFCRNTFKFTFVPSNSSSNNLMFSQQIKFFQQPSDDNALDITRLIFQIQI